MNWESYTRKSSLCIIFLAGLLSVGFYDHTSAWKKVWLSVPESEVNKIFTSSNTPTEFWITTPKALYRTDHFKKLSLVFSKTVHWVTQDPDDPNVIYLATDEGLFAREDGKNFTRIFQASDRNKRRCLSVISARGSLLVGTQQGLFTRDEDDDRWQAVGGALSTEAIPLLASYGDVVYVTTATSLYRYDPRTGTYKEVFSVGLSHEVEQQGDASEDDSEEVLEFQGNILDVDVINANQLYVSTHRGIFYTSDGAITWKRLPNEGLPNDYLKSLIVIKERDGVPFFVAATSRGVYTYKDNRWEQMYRGLDTNQVSDLISDVDGNIYAATNRGIYILPYRQASPSSTAMAAPSTTDGPSPFADYQDIERYFQGEPSIREVQAMAIHYAEVHPDKISKWRKQARMRAFVPSVSAGIDRSATDLLHWDTGANPDVLVRGNDFIDWDVGFSWDLGDFVWSSDQTSIDSRSKLMVELREEVLDQVTRLYFERRRLQVEIISQTDAPSEAKIDSQMRLAELTAIIDGFTGGEFSRKIEGQQECLKV